MSTIVSSLKLLGLSFAYFFIISFVIFITNLILRNAVWGFVEGTTALYIAHNVVCLFALLVGTMAVAPIFKKELVKINHKYFIAASVMWMTAFVVITNCYLIEKVTRSEFTVQLVNSVLIIVFFALLSYSYIIKDLNKKEEEK